MPQYSREQILDLYRALPEELKDAIGSESTINTIEEVSTEHSLNNEQHSALVDNLGYVILGLLPPYEFKQALEDAGIEKSVAEKIDKTIHRFVFYPVRKNLNVLYEITLQPPAPGAANPEAQPQKRGPIRKDSYREIVE